MFIILPFIFVYLFACIPFSRKLYLQIVCLYLFILFAVVDIYTTGDSYGYSLYFNTVNPILDAFEKGRLVEDTSTYKYYLEIAFTGLLSLFKTFSKDSQQLIVIISSAIQYFFIYKALRILNLNKFLSASIITNYLGLSGIFFSLHYLRQGIAASLLFYGFTLIFVSDKKKIIGMICILLGGTFHISSFLLIVPLIIFINKLISPKIILIFGSIAFIFSQVKGSVIIQKYYSELFNLIPLNTKLYFLNAVTERDFYRLSYTLIFAIVVWIIITIYINRSNINTIEMSRMIFQIKKNEIKFHSNNIVYFAYSGLTTLILLSSIGTFIPYLGRGYFSLYIFIGMAIAAISNREKVYSLYPFLGLPGILIFTYQLLNQPILQNIYFYKPQTFF